MVSTEALPRSPRWWPWEGLGAPPGVTKVALGRGWEATPGHRLPAVRGPGVFGRRGAGGAGGGGNFFWGPKLELKKRSRYRVRCFEEGARSSGNSMNRPRYRVRGIGYADLGDGSGGFRCRVRQDATVDGALYL